MGMDVYGRTPSAESGKYFRASVWSWRPIHSLMCSLCSDVVPPALLHQMNYNDGKGPLTQAMRTQIADRFDQHLENNTDGTELEESTMRAGEDGQLYLDGKVPPGVKTHSPYSVTDDMLKRWVEFLRHCGGFRVC